MLSSTAVTCHTIPVADMLLRKKFHPNDYNASVGWAVSADYRYLIGVTVGCD